MEYSCDRDHVVKTLSRFICVTVQISQEVDRRLRLSVMSAERAAAIKEVYQPLHPSVYHLKVFSSAATADGVSDFASLTHNLLRSHTSHRSSSRLLSTVEGRMPHMKVSWTCWKRRQVSCYLFILVAEDKLKFLVYYLYSRGSEHLCFCKKQWKIRYDDVPVYGCQIAAVLYSDV